MSWKDQLKGDSISWLLQHETPGVRFLVLRDLLDTPADHAELLKAQQEAMKSGKGIWGNWKERNTIYSGNRSSRRFHLKTCALGQRISSQNRIQFNRKWDAFWAGYSPCKKCMGQGPIE